MLSLDHYGVIPKYLQIYDIIREKIERGEWQPHEAIPSERELEAMFNVSRTTVRQAMSNLVERSYLYRDQGRGTFVAPRKLQHSLHLLTSFTDDMLARGLKPGQRLLSISNEEPSAFLRERLELGTEIVNILKIERIRFGDGEPIGIHQAYLPMGEGQTLTAEEINSSGWEYTLLARKFNLIASSADETLEATSANEREASLLGIPNGSPLLLIERLTWSRLHRPMEFVKMLYRADRYKYSVHIAQ